MIRFISACILFLAAVGCASADSSFQRATIVAYDIIQKELSPPICKPSSVTPEQRNDLVRALEAVTVAGLSEPTGLTPLTFAVIADDVPSVERFVAIGYPLSERDIHGGVLLHSAAFHGSSRALSFLLAHGANPDEMNENGATPLMVAAAGNRPGIAQALLSAGASAALRARDGQTALYPALACRNQALVDVLLKAGAPVDEKARTLAAKFGVSLVLGDR